LRKLTALTAVILALILVSYAFAGSTTPLGAVVANNTSTSSKFAGTSGNLAASNVSKVDIRTLLYPGATTKIYAHFMPWFGSGHMDTGYRSDDAAQVRRQVDDMISRGIQGVMIDWYGPNAATEDNTTKAMMQDAESRGGKFVFAIIEDGGGLNVCHNTPGCDVTQQAIKDLTYAYNTYQKSSAYMRIDGRPVVGFFDPDRFGTLNWDQIRAAVPGNPLFIFKDAADFNHAQSNGSMSWVGISGDRNDWGQTYHDYFYTTAQQHPGQHTFGSAKKGFDDTGALWSRNRVVNQNCGATWLNTFASIAKFYNASKQLESLQIVTWNDYEEGTAIETGIENCVAVNAVIQGTALRWSISGDPRTLDHFTVYMTSDGQDLEAVGDFPVSANSMDVGSLGGSHTFFVQAVGKPSMTNHTSNGVSYPTAGASFLVGAGPDSGKLPAGQSGSYQVTVVPVNGFQGDVSLSCEAPANMKCSLAQGAVTLNGAIAKTTLSVSAGATTASAGHTGTAPLFAFLPSLGVAGFVLTGESKKRKLAAILGLCAILLLMGFAAGCGGGGMTSKPGAAPVVSVASDGRTPQPSPQPSASPQAFTITATSGGVQQTTTLHLQ
jgi:hypothetical protein